MGLWDFAGRTLVLCHIWVFHRAKTQMWGYHSLKFVITLRSPKEPQLLGGNSPPNSLVGLHYTEKFRIIGLGGARRKNPRRPYYCYIVYTESHPPVKFSERNANNATTA